MEKRRRIGACGSYGLLAFNRTRKALEWAYCETYLLARLYPTPELLKLEKTVKRNVDELEKIGKKMGV
jgi:hypothetical protein